GDVDGLARDAGFAAVRRERFQHKTGSGPVRGSTASMSDPPWSAVHEVGRSICAGSRSTTGCRLPPNVLMSGLTAHRVVWPFRRGGAASRLALRSRCRLAHCLSERSAEVGVVAAYVDAGCLE